MPQQGHLREFSSSELHDGGELQSSRASASQKWIANSDIPGCLQRVVAAVTSSCWIRSANIADKVGQQRAREVGMIQKVEELSPQFEIYMLGEARALEHRKVEFLEARPFERIAAKTAEVTRPRDAIAYVTRSWILQGIPGTRRRKGSETQEMKWISEVVLHGTHYVGTIEALSCSGVVSFEFVIQVPRLSILQVQNSVDAPPVHQFLHAAVTLGKFITEIPGKAAANVEAGITAISSGKCAVLWLRLVGLEVLKVAGGINRVRPHEVRLRSDSVPLGGAQAGLQGMVHGVCTRFLLVQVEEVGIVARRTVAADPVG